MIDGHFLNRIREVIAEGKKGDRCTLQLIDYVMDVIAPEIPELVPPIYIEGVILGLAYA